MTEEKVTCTKIIRIDDGVDNQGKPVSHHEACGKPASEVQIGGMLTSCKAILCARHKKMADRESFTSVNGFPKGRVLRKAKAQGYQQERLPGTGLRGQ